MYASNLIDDTVDLKGMNSKGAENERSSEYIPRKRGIIRMT